MTTALVALLDGRLVPPTMPMLRPDDPGAVRGDGIFEASLAVHGRVRDLPEHLDRLALSARALDLDIPGPADWRRGIDAVVGAWAGGEMALRLFASRGVDGGAPTCWVTGAAVPQSSVDQRTAGIRVLLLDRGYTGAAAAAAPWLLAGAKSLSYAINMAALRHAAAHDADDVVFVGSDGAVLEAPTAGVVAAYGRRLVTPPLDGILDSITVRRLFAAAAAAGWDTAYSRLSPADLAVADGIWLASSVRLFAPVTSIDGRPCALGPTAELAGLLGVPA